MPNPKLRRRIASEAARLMFGREEPELSQARRQAARQVCRRELNRRDLPSDREIHDQFHALVREQQGRHQAEQVRAMRVEALRVMEILRPFCPRLVGAALSGYGRGELRIELHVFSDQIEEVVSALEAEGHCCEVGKNHRQRDEPPPPCKIHFRDRFAFELILFPEDQANLPRYGPVTGREVADAGIADIEKMLLQDASLVKTVAPDAGAFSPADRFHLYETLLVPLEEVHENPTYHPEGDALYHSLQVFTLAREELPYDEEFILAALLHDVGKAIDPKDHISAALEALEGYVTPRTAWLIEHHGEALALREGELGIRARRRLEASEDFAELRLLADCDRAGRRRGVPTPDIQEALEYIRDLAEMFEE